MNPYYFLGLRGKRLAELGVGAAKIFSSRPQPGPLPRFHLSVLLRKPSNVLMVTWCKASDSHITETLISLAVSIATTLSYHKGRAGQGIKGINRDSCTLPCITSSLTVALPLSRLSHRGRSRKGTSSAKVSRKEGRASGKRWLCNQSAIVRSPCRPHQPCPSDLNPTPASEGH